MVSADRRDVGVDVTGIASNSCYSSSSDSSRGAAPRERKRLIRRTRDLLAKHLLCFLVTCLATIAAGYLAPLIDIRTATPMVCENETAAAAGINPRAPACICKPSDTFAMLAGDVLKKMTEGSANADIGLLTSSREEEPDVQQEELVINDIMLRMDVMTPGWFHLAKRESGAGGAAQEWVKPSLFNNHLKFCIHLPIPIPSKFVQEILILSQNTTNLLDEAIIPKAACEGGLKPPFNLLFKKLIWC